MALPATTSTLGEEAALLAEVYQVLQQQKNPALALARLDLYRERFPNGVLGPEAALAEAEAQRAGRHTEAALAALDRLGGDGSSRVDVEVLRGELLAEGGNCAAASVALDRVLARAPAGMLGERATFTRASCAESLGAPDARRLLQSYLAQWPEGVFAARARALLEFVP